LRALAAAAARELLWGLRAASREIERWRRRALSIPDLTLRADALDVLARKRTHLHGAALFWTLPRRRNPDLLRLLVAYELIWDLLDNLSERAAAVGQTDGRTLHLAIAEAIDPSATISDYYQQHPWRYDGSYLRALVDTCQGCCRRLPGYPMIRELALSEADRAQVLALNHYPDAAQRDTALKRWVSEQHPHERNPSWWELSGSASAPLTIHALLALAAEPGFSRETMIRTHAAYRCSVCAATTMLDSYVDQAEDRANGNHSYVAHYPDPVAAADGIRKLIHASLAQTRALPGGHRHAVIAAAMIALYLSKDDANAGALRIRTQSFIDTGGSLTRLMLPVLRAWRTAYQQRSA
jgi:tetraprenyl-beta-curcumene synthase